MWYTQASKGDTIDHFKDSPEEAHAIGSRANEQTPTIGGTEDRDTRAHTHGRTSSDTHTRQTRKRMQTDTHTHTNHLTHTHLTGGPPDALPLPLSASRSSSSSESCAPSRMTPTAVDSGSAGVPVTTLLSFTLGGRRCADIGREDREMGTGIIGIAPPPPAVGDCTGRGGEGREGERRGRQGRERGWGKGEVRREGSQKRDETQERNGKRDEAERGNGSAGAIGNKGSRRGIRRERA